MCHEQHTYLHIIIMIAALIGLLLPVSHMHLVTIMLETWSSSTTATLS